MARLFSVKPALTFRGRKFLGIRGWAGKPTHPPLTDFPVAAYVMTAIFDVIASIGRKETFARDFFRAGTYVVIAGAAVSVLTALTGFWDWLRSTEKGTQARRTARSGCAGKPTHPPLTDFPVAAYVMTAIFDVIASIGRKETFARDFFRAGTYVVIAGAAVSVLTALTGFWDWLRSTEKGTQARRTANT